MNRIGDGRVCRTLNGILRAGQQRGTPIFRDFPHAGIGGITNRGIEGCLNEVGTQEADFIHIGCRLPVVEPQSLAEEGTACAVRLPDAAEFEQVVVGCRGDQVVISCNLRSKQGISANFCGRVFADAGQIDRQICAAGPLTVEKFSNAADKTADFGKREGRSARILRYKFLVHKIPVSKTAIVLKERAIVSQWEGFKTAQSRRLPGVAAQDSHQISRKNTHVVGIEESAADAGPESTVAIGISVHGCDGVTCFPGRVGFLPSRSACPCSIFRNLRRGRPARGRYPGAPVFDSGDMRALHAHRALEIAFDFCRRRPVGLFNGERRDGSRFCGMHQGSLAFIDRNFPHADFWIDVAPDGETAGLSIDHQRTGCQETDLIVFCSIPVASVKARHLSFEPLRIIFISRDPASAVVNMERIRFRSAVCVDQKHREERRVFVTGVGSHSGDVRLAAKE